MSVFHAPESVIGKELWKWDHYEDESNPHDPGTRGLRKRAYQPFPALMYMVTHRNPLRFEYREATTERHAQELERQGFVMGGRAKAVEAYDRREFDLAELAANRAYGEQRMGEKARAEAAAYESDADGHVAEIPEQPIARRGRPKKTESAA